jgi:hypothetical protein
VQEKGVAKAHRCPPVGAMITCLSARDAHFILTTDRLDVTPAIELNSFSIKSKHCPYSFQITELVAQIEFTEWTPDNHLRHSKFMGLRDDKEAGGEVQNLIAKHGYNRWRNRSLSRQATKTHSSEQFS